MNMVEALFTHRGFYKVREVVKDDFNRSSNEFETTNPFTYTMNHDVLSHMSLQGFAKFANGEKRDLDVIPCIYPFTIEFEPKLHPNDGGFNAEYRKALQEALRFYTFLKYQIVEDSKDVAIFMTPSRSIYIMLNPKCYGATQSTMLHLIYRKMFDTIDTAFEFDKNYIDKCFFKKSQLIKTPNAFYCGGYVVPITGVELQSLASNPELKMKLTRNKRSLFNIEMPGVISYNLSKMYLDAKEEAKKEYYNKLNEADLTITDPNFMPPCLKYANELNKDQVEGNVNFILTTNAIVCKNKKLVKASAIDLLEGLAKKWNNDQLKNVSSIVNCVYNHDTKFSCGIIKENLDIQEEDTCISCPYNSKCYEKTEGFTIHTDIINELIGNNKAYKRHYESYLILCRQSAWGKELTKEKLEELKLDRRTVLELSRFSSCFNISKKNGELTIENTAKEKAFVLPYAFIDAGEYKCIGTRLKHYLAMYCLAWRKAPKKKTHIYFKLNKETVMSLLKIKSESSYYKMLKDLESMGLLEHIQNGFVRVFYKNYKVIEFKDYEDEKVEVTQLSFGPRVEKMVVGYTNVQQTKLSENRGIVQRYKGPPE